MTGAEKWVTWGGRFAGTHGTPLPNVRGYFSCLSTGPRLNVPNRKKCAPRVMSWSLEARPALCQLCCGFRPCSRWLLLQSSRVSIMRAKCLTCTCSLLMFCTVFFLTCHKTLGANLLFTVFCRNFGPRVLPRDACRLG